MADRQLMMRANNHEPVVIANGQTLSGFVRMKTSSMCGVILPAEWDGTVLKFQVSNDGSTYYPLYNTSNAEVSLTVAASRAYELPTSLAMWDWVKLSAGTAQTGDTTCIFVRKS
jgi:hypothetical protein